MPKPISFPCWSVLRRFFCAYAVFCAFASNGFAWAVVTLDTAEHRFNQVADLSRLTLQIDLFGGIAVNLTDVPISGVKPVDFALDATNSGTISGDGLAPGTFALANRSYSFLGLLVGTVETVNIGGSLTIGTELTLTRNFVIDSADPGRLGLDSGLLRFVFTGGALYNDFVAGTGGNVFEVDLTVDPLSFDFSDLGTTTLAGTTDDDLSGLDYDGAELNLPLAGFTTTHWIGSTTPISLSGNLYLGSNVVLPPIPEFTSLGLLSLAVAGVGGAVVVRRSRQHRIPLAT